MFGAALGLVLVDVPEVAGGDGVAGDEGQRWRRVEHVMNGPACVRTARDIGTFVAVGVVQAAHGAAGQEVVVEPVEGDDGVVKTVSWNRGDHAVDQTVEHVVSDVLGEHVLKKPPEDGLGDSAAAAPATTVASPPGKGRNRSRGRCCGRSRSSGCSECRGRQGWDGWEVDLC